MRADDRGNARPVDERGFSGLGALEAAAELSPVPADRLEEETGHRHTPAPRPPLARHEGPPPPLTRRPPRDDLLPPICERVEDVPALARELHGEALLGAEPVEHPLAPGRV